MMDHITCACCAAQDELRRIGAGMQPIGPDADQPSNEVTIWLMPTWARGV